MQIPQNAVGRMQVVKAVDFGNIRRIGQGFGKHLHIPLVPGHMKRIYAACGIFGQLPQ